MGEGTLIVAITGVQVNWGVTYYKRGTFWPFCNLI